MLNLISQWWTTMASSLVLVLLMDNLPGIFLNETLETSHPFGQKLDIHQCDPVTQPIIDLVNRNVMGRRGKPADDEHDFNSYLAITKHHSLQNESPEAFQNLLENSVENSKSIEMQLLNSNKYVDANAYEEDADKSECENPKYKPDDGSVLSDHFELAKTEFPKTVSFLVAIFESLQNVTAQTCGGTVVAPHWVLTAASCVDVLGSMYGNSTNTSSSYTVIANSTDPLRGGSVHNVTGVTVHPGGAGGGPAPAPAPAPAVAVAGLARPLARRRHPTARTKTPSLALLRVEPALQLPTAPLQPAAGRSLGGDVAVYGWQLHKNDKTNATSMRGTWFAARALSRYECELQYGVTDAGGVLCLATSSDTVAGAAQMSIGGPVLALRGGALQLAAVALPGDSPPLLAAPVAAHSTWIHRVLDTTATNGV